MTITNETLIALERQIAEYRQNPSIVPYGWPVSLVDELVKTIRMQKKLKKQFQHSNEKRGKTIMEIYSLASRSIYDSSE